VYRQTRLQEIIDFFKKIDRQKNADYGRQDDAQIFENLTNEIAIENQHGIEDQSGVIS
jgi:hypothetical protein